MNSYNNRVSNHNCALNRSISTYTTTMIFIPKKIEKSSAGNIKVSKNNSNIL